MRERRAKDRAPREALKSGQRIVNKEHERTRPHSSNITKVLLEETDRIGDENLGGQSAAKKDQS